MGTTCRIIVQKRRNYPLFVDFRKLNAVARQDSYSVPRMNECIDLLGKATKFLMLDAKSGFWQIDIEDADKDKAYFTSRHGLYCLFRMTCCLQNAPDTFQRSMKVILSSGKIQFASAHLDDIMIFNRTHEHDMHHFQKILLFISRAGVMFKLKKYSFL